MGGPSTVSAFRSVVALPAHWNAAPDDTGHSPELLRDGLVLRTLGAYRSLYVTVATDHRGPGAVTTVRTLRDALQYPIRGDEAAETVPVGGLLVPFGSFYLAVVTVRLYAEGVAAATRSGGEPEPREQVV